MCMNYTELQAVRERLEEHVAQILHPALNRSQQRHWGSLFIRGFLLDGERKSAGALAERLPDGNEQAMQQFLTDSTWDFRDVRRRLAQQAESWLPAEAVWVHDDTGFPKKGEHSVGVARQYSGTLGKVGNCQIGVSMHLATQAGSVPLDWELYLPEEWTDDPERCRKARVPEERIAHRAKWELALELTERVISWQLQTQIVVADAGYGVVTDYRDGLAARRLQYVVGITGNIGFWVGTVPAQPPQPNGFGRPRTRYDYGDHRPQSALNIALSLPTEQWTELTWDQGSKGPLRSRFAAIRVHPSHGYHQGKPPRPEEWLIIEWPPSEDKPTDFWLSNLPDDVPLNELVRLAKMRWHIEQDYQQLKEELGLDHFEGRKWVGWHRHVTLTMVAFGFLLRERLLHQKRGT